jgi:hypothetical protein
VAKALGPSLDPLARALPTDPAAQLEAESRGRRRRRLPRLSMERNRSPQAVRLLIMADEIPRKIL